MKQKKYPYIKIIIGFTLAPNLVSFIVGFVMGAGVLAGGVDKLLTAAATVFLIGVVGSFYFGIPAFLASIIYAVLRLYRAWYSFLLVTIVGGSAAYLWAAILWGDEESILSNIISADGVAFILGALSSLLMACFILPQRPAEPPKREQE